MYIRDRHWGSYTSSWFYTMLISNINIMISECYILVGNNVKFFFNQSLIIIGLHLW